MSPRPYLAPGGAEGAVGGHGDRVQVPRVPDVVRLQLAVGQVPHLGREKRDERGQILGSQGEIPPGGPTLTLTSLSQPQDTMMGLLLLGEKRTHDTHSEWLSSCGGTAPVAGRERGRSPPRAPLNQQDWGLPEIGPKPTGNDPKPTRTGPNPLGSASSPPPPAHLHRVLADPQRVPELDGLVPGAGHDLPVVRGEGDAQHVLGVAHEAPRGRPAAGTATG